MTKKLLVVFMALFALQAIAQDSTTASPYSFYGIGSLKFKGTVENRSMGGISIFNDSIHINLKNPASFAGRNLNSWNNENRPVKFSVGASHSSTNLQSKEGEANTSSTTFDYLALSLPLGKFGVGLGLLPYTSVGYNLQDFDGDRLEGEFNGNGGLNKAFFDLAYLFSDQLSFGAEVSYNFGKIENNILNYQYDDEGNLVDFQTLEANRSDLSGLSVNLGLTYRTMLNDRLELQSGITYAPVSNITSTNQRSYTIFDVNNPQPGEGSFTEVNLNPDNGPDLRKTDLTLPSRFSVGAGIGQPRKWFVGADYTFRKTSSFANPFISINNANYVDASNLSVGGFYIPNFISLSSYWKRVVYRFGFNFENTGIQINSQDIKQFGMSFGLGIPVGENGSNANIGFEFGQRGTTDQNLIQENFINLRISLSLNDKWFEKRKYN